LAKFLSLREEKISEQSLHHNVLYLNRLRQKDGLKTIRKGVEDGGQTTEVSSCLLFSYGVFLFKKSPGVIGSSHTKKT